MNWYKKDTRIQVLFAHSDLDKGELATILKNSLISTDISIDLISTKEARDYKPEYNQKIVCTDIESTIAFSKAKTYVHVFSKSPYTLIETSGLPIAEQKSQYSALHRSLNKSRRVIALSEKCRIETQQFHSGHVYISSIPATFSPLISSLEHEGIAVIANECEFNKYERTLATLARYKPVLYLNSKENRFTSETLGMRMPDNGFVATRPLIQIYLGRDQSDCTPLRIIDASGAGSVVIQIAHSDAERNVGRWMPNDCVGYFSIETLEGDFSELEAFILHLLTNQMFFDSVLAAQRRYLPNYKSNTNAFLEMLTK